MKFSQGFYRASTGFVGFQKMGCTVLYRFCWAAVRFYIGVFKSGLIRFYHVLLIFLTVGAGVSYFRVLTVSPSKPWFRQASSQGAEAKKLDAGFRV